MPEQTETEEQRQYTVDLGETIRALVAASPCYWRYVGHFVRALKIFSGSTSPGEQFIVHMVLTYGTRGRLEIEDVESELETFRENFRDAVEMVQRMQQQYPEQLQSKGGGPEA